MASPLLTPQKDDDRLNPGAQDFNDIIDRNYSPQEKERLERIKQLGDQEQNAASGALANNQQALSAQERSPWQTVMPGQRNPNQSSNGKQRFGRFSKQRIFVGGGIVGSLLSIFFVLNMFLPLKIPSIMNAVTDSVGGRVEHIVAIRAERFLLQYMVAGSNAAARSGGIIATGNPLGDLFANIRTSRFEANLKASHGLEIQAGSRRGTIKLVTNGRTLGEASNVAQLQNLLDRDDLTARESRQVIKAVVKDEIPAWRWHKRHKFAKWLKLYHGVGRFGIKNSDQNTREKRVQEMQRTRMTDAVNKRLSSALDALNCLLGESCSVEKLGGDSKNLKNSPQTSQIASDLEDAAKEHVSQSTKEALNLSSNINTTFSKIITNKLLTKAIPIIGWIDIAATLDHISYELNENDAVKAIPAYFKERSYAQLYGEWAGYGGQTQAGDMLDEYSAVLSTQTEGIEESCAYNYMNRKNNTGVCMSDAEKINSNNSESMTKQLWDIGHKMPGSIVTHTVLNLYYESLGGGGLLGWIGGHLGDWIGKLADFFTPDSFQEWMVAFLSEFTDELLSMLGWVADPNETGAKLMNAIHAGGTASFDTFCELEMGCQTLNANQATQLANEAHAEQQAYMASLPLSKRLFSLDHSASLASTLARQMPVVSSMFELNSLATSGLAAVSTIPNQLANIVTPAAHAQANFVWQDLYGTDPKGIPTSELGYEIIPELSEKDFDPDAEGVCDDKEGRAKTRCQTDSSVFSAIECNFTDKCLDVDIGGSISIGGGVGDKVDYSNLYKKMDAGTLPSSLLCSPKPNQKGFKLLCGPATESFKAMNAAFKEEFGRDMMVGGGYRTKQAQLEGAAKSGTFAPYRPNDPPPGHLWGTSIDFDTGANRWGSASSEYQQWTVKNGPRYGWFWPTWARSCGGSACVPEPWHFDYFFAGHNQSKNRDSLDYDLTKPPK